MSLRDLLIHTCNIYTLSTSQDDLMDTVESLPSSADETGVRCRFEPVRRQEREAYGAVDMAELYLVTFEEDKELTAANALVWNDKVWRVREYSDPASAGLCYVAVVEHNPQVEISAPS